MYINIYIYNVYYTYILCIMYIYVLCIHYIYIYISLLFNSL